MIFDNSIVTLVCLTQAIFTRKEVARMIMTEKMNIEIENIENILADNELSDTEKIKLIEQTIKAIRR